MLITQYTAPLHSYWTSIQTRTLAIELRWARVKYHIKWKRPHTNPVINMDIDDGIQAIRFSLTLHDYCHRSCGTKYVPTLPMNMISLIWQVLMPFICTLDFFTLCLCSWGLSRHPRENCPALKNPLDQTKRIKNRRHPSTVSHEAINLGILAFFHHHA